MSLPDNTFDLNELAQSAGVTARTIRYYVNQGLLPPAATRGPGTRYERAHLDRLQLIRQLQRQHLPLAEIRKRLEGLTDDTVRELIEAAPEPPPRNSALDYVREVLGAHPAPPPAPIAAPMFAPRAARYESAPQTMPAPSAPASPPAPNESPATGPGRSQWDRISLAPDVELHVRRPLSREENRRVERLLDSARTIFEEGT